VLTFDDAGWPAKKFNNYRVGAAGNTILVYVNIRSTGDIYTSPSIVGSIRHRESNFKRVKVYYDGLETMKLFWNKPYTRFLEKM
jgi:hypothetical protein